MKYEAKHEIKNEEPRILRLFPAENHDGISSSIKLSWRVSDNVATFLSNTNTNPYLLLISARRVGNRMVERGRRVVPLSDGSVYPEFFGPGDYTVIPIIVSEKPSLYLKRHLDGYAIDVIDDDGDVIDRDDKMVGDPLDIHVPEGLFGKIPNRTLARWVNLWFESHPRDQCAFRRRFILAFTLQPIGVALWLVATTVFRAAVAMLLFFGFGTRGVSFSPIFHPWTEDASDVWFRINNILYDSVFWSNEDGDPRYLASFTPICLVLLYGASLIWAPPIEALWAISLAAFPLVVALCIFVLCAVARGFSALFGLFRGKKHKITSTRSVAAKVKPKTVPPLYTAAATNEKEKKRPSVRLWFSDIKAKVCKPYPVMNEEDYRG